MEINKITGKEYTGSNQALLQVTRNSNGYKLPEWITYVQARTISKAPRKGEKGTHLARVIEYTDKKGKDKKGLRTFVVFNVEQLKAL